MAQLKYEGVSTPTFSGLPDMLLAGQKIFGNAGTAAEEALKEYGRIQKDKVLKPWALDTLTTMDPVQRMELANKYKEQLTNNPWITGEDITKQGTWNSTQFADANTYQTEIQNRALATAMKDVLNASSPEEKLSLQNSFDEKALGATNYGKLIEFNRDQLLGEYESDLAKASSLLEKEAVHKKWAPHFSQMGNSALRAREELTQGMNNSKTVLAEQQRQELNAITAKFEELYHIDPAKALQYLGTVTPTTLNVSDIRNRLKTNYDAYINRDVESLNTKRDAFMKDLGLSPEEAQYNEEFIELVRNSPEAVRNAYLAQAGISKDWDKITRRPSTEIKTNTSYGLTLNKRLADATNASKKSSTFAKMGIDIPFAPLEKERKEVGSNLGTDFADMSLEEQQQVIDSMNHVMTDPFKGYEASQWYSPLNEAINKTAIKNWVKDDANVASLVIGYADQFGPEAGKELVKYLVSNPGISKDQFAQLLYDKMGNPDKWTGMRSEHEKAVLAGREALKKQWIAAGGTEKSFNEAFINGRFNHQGLVDQAKKDKQTINQITEEIKKAQTDGTYNTTVDLTNISNPEVISKDPTSMYYNKNIETVAGDNLLNENVKAASTILNKLESTQPSTPIIDQATNLVSALVGKTSTSNSNSESIRSHTLRQINKLKSWGIPEEAIVDSLSRTPDTNNFIYAFLTGRDGQYDADTAFKFLKEKYGITDNMTPDQINQKIRSNISTGNYVKDKMIKYREEALTIRTNAKEAKAKYIEAKNRGEFKLASVWKNKYNSLMAEASLLNQKINS